MDKDNGSANVLSLVVATTEEDKWQAMLREIEAKLPREAELSSIVARSVKVRFDALIKEGFSEPQALALTMKWTWQ